MSEYPIILIPSAIARIQSELPPLPIRSKPRPPEQPHPPQMPGSSPQAIDVGLLCLAGAIGLLFSVALLTINQGLGTLALLALCGALIWSFWYNRVKLPDLRNQYQRQQQEYERQSLRYQDELEALPAREMEYEQDLKQYGVELAQLKAKYHTLEKIAEFRNERQRQILKQTLSYDGDNGKARSGHSERILAEQLNRYFPGRIRRKLTLTIPGYEHPYEPDFAYIDSALGLHIDIEVDEPYGYQSLEPIHYIGKDDRRNDFFLERGWVVIRFSEHQVRENAKGCCKVVAKTVAEITGDSAIFKPMKGLPDLKLMPQWTYEEAAHMALTRRRDR
jgi:hypothetical protein